MALADIVERMLPEKVAGVKEVSLPLNGYWDFRFDEHSSWESVIVPGELAMQGFAIEHDKPVLYRKKVVVPADFKGKRVILRFDGVYSHARLWVNGREVTEHDGGFTRWEADITSWVKIGKRNEIRLEVTDRKDEISYASGYAHHPIGGILRDVTLYALPEAHLENFYVEAIPDSLFQDATLRVGYRMTEKADVAFRLVAPDGTAVPLENSKVTSAAGENLYEFRVSKPLLWDAEHPRLYRLQVEVGGNEGFRFTREVGFRKIEIRGNRMLVNGKPVKLRGACRHDIHPTLGRTTNAELDSLDVALFKRSNMNFVRTSHYPPTEAFLTYCDRMGLYVECETAVCFVNTHRQKNYAPAASQDDDSFTYRYLGQLQEMVHTHRSHASVLFWSVGNESVYGKNFQLCYDWVKHTDTTRPAIFSYPGYVPAGKQMYDIVSMHYPGCDGDLNQLGTRTEGFEHPDKPALFDEWAHVPCYTYTTLQDDPNIREFWGISLDKMWSTLFASQGGLGGAIWCYSDERFMLPVPRKGTPYWIEFAHTAKPEGFRGNCVGYGEWGIVDVWRREKPEFWGTKKAYSPVRLMQTEIPTVTPGEPIRLTLYNRFDHTNLNEIRIRCTRSGEVGKFLTAEIAPHQKGILELPASDWKQGEIVFIEFLTNAGDLIDAENVTLGQVVRPSLIRSVSPLKVEDSSDHFIVKGDHFEIPFNKETGLIESATSYGKVVIEKGPFLNLDLNVSHKTGAEVREKAPNYIVSDNDWQKQSLSYEQINNNVRVHIKGKYLGIDLSVDLLIEANGSIQAGYTTKGEPNGWLREAGLKWYLADTFSTLDWNRKGYWSYYPEGSFAGNVGKAPLYNDKFVAYGEDPKQSWNLDTHDYYYFADAGALSERPLTHQAKGMKENIYIYRLGVEAGDAGITVCSSDASVACRLNKLADEQLILYTDNRWDYPEIAWGDYCKALEVTPVYGTIHIKL